MNITLIPAIINVYLLLYYPHLFGIIQSWSAAVTPACHTEGSVIILSEMSTSRLIFVESRRQILMYWNLFLHLFCAVWGWSFWHVFFPFEDSLQLASVMFVLQLPSSLCRLCTPLVLYVSKLFWQTPWELWYLSCLNHLHSLFENTRHWPDDIGNNERSDRQRDCAQWREGKGQPRSALLAGPTPKGQTTDCVWKIVILF